MVDVEITDVDGDEVTLPHPMERGSPMNQDLSYFRQIVGEFLSQYGWYVLVFTMFIYLLIQQLSKRRARQSTQPQTEQDASLVTRRQEAMEAARRKMQEELDARAAVFKEKLKQTTEETSSSTTALQPKTHKKPLRSADYNPLSGHGGGSCSWRPGRRGPTSGG